MYEYSQKCAIISVFLLYAYGFDGFDALRFFVFAHTGANLIYRRFMNFLCIFLIALLAVVLAHFCSE